jgi:hypothetical protein
MNARAGTMGPQAAVARARSASAARTRWPFLIDLGSSNVRRFRSWDFLVEFLRESRAAGPVVAATRARREIVRPRR